MSNQPNRRSCTHIKVTGVRCGSPALRGEQFCYFHQRMLRGVRTPPQDRLHPIALIEDEESIQAALMEVINALMRNTIDLKRATLILRALHIAVKNAGRVKFGVQGRSAVQDVPEYEVPAYSAPAAPPDAAADANVAPAKTEFEIPASAAPKQPDQTFWERWEAGAPNVVKADVVPPHVGTAALACPGGEVNHVGTGALARPSGPAVSGRSAVPPATPPPAPRKPPASANEPPKQRKVAAHGASGG